MKTNPNDPAHPNPNHEGVSGISKREYIASLAMQGFIAPNCNPDNGMPTPFPYLAMWAVGMADALINELNKEK